MRYVRIVNLVHFDHRTNKFKDLAFTPSGGAASVFDEDCGRATSGSVCAHIAAFYSDVAGNPPAYWPFEDSRLKQPYSVVATPSDGKNIDYWCHREISGHSKTSLKKMLKTVIDTWKVSDLFICDSNGSRPLNLSDIPPESDR